jgi:hypothetical protein
MKQLKSNPGGIPEHIIWISRIQRGCMEGFGITIKFAADEPFSGNILGFRLMKVQSKERRNTMLSGTVKSLR